MSEIPHSLKLHVPNIVSIDQIVDRTAWSRQAVKRRVKSGKLAPAEVGQWGARRLYWWPAVSSIHESELNDLDDLRDW